MKYVVKEPTKANLTADADALMREFNRGMAIVYEDVDQNNILNESIQWPLIAHPVKQWESSTSIVGQKTGLIQPQAHAVDQGTSTQTLSAPSASDAGDYEERTENRFWEYVEDADGNKLTLSSLTLSEATEMTVIASGQILIADEDATADGAQRTSIYDIRILDGGQPLDPVCTVSAETNNGFVPFYVCAKELLTPGDHTLRLQIRDRSNGAVASQVEKTVLCGFGFVR